MVCTCKVNRKPTQLLIAETVGNHLEMTDFKNIPLELKNLLVHSLMLPFWYMSIYVFYPELYNKSDSIIIYATCICLTICSAFIASMLTLATEKEEKDILHRNIVYPSCVIQISWFSLLFIISYVSKKVWNNTFEFYGFVLTYFIFMLILYILFSNETRKETNKGEQKSGK